LPALLHHQTGRHGTRTEHRQTARGRLRRHAEDRVRAGEGKHLPRDAAGARIRRRAMNTVLIVDDVAALREQYAYDLARLGGFRTLVAASGEEALETMRHETVDCLVLDLEMPGLDGFDVLDMLKRSGSTVPVIVYTGTGNYDRCVRA